MERTAAYFPKNTMSFLAPLLNNFQAFIARAGFRILQVPDTPQEYVGQHLLYAYLDHFVRIVGADMFLEVQTGAGTDRLAASSQPAKIYRGDKDMGGTPVLSIW